MTKKRQRLMPDRSFLYWPFFEPRTFIPGAKMTFHLSQKSDRDDVIAYLKQESGK